MVPHALFVSSDRSVDLALNLLTLVVVGALLASVAAFAYAWLNPPIRVRDHGDVGPPLWAAMSDARLAPPRIDFELALPLPLPSRPLVYRCEHRGEITYTDRPCPRGVVRPVTIRSF